MPIFDPAIFDGTTGGSIFDDGAGVIPALPAATKSLAVQLVAITLSVAISKITIPVNLSGLYIAGEVAVIEELRIIENDEIREIETGEERAIE